MIEHPIKFNLINDGRLTILLTIGRLLCKRLNGELFPVLQPLP